MNNPVTDYIAEVIDNPGLAEALTESLGLAIRHSQVNVAGCRDPESLFKLSLDVAASDIREDPRGKLFQRLVGVGPCNINRTDTIAHLAEDGALSEAECAICVEFICSHMINRFKGELAEILAIAPCIDVMEQLQQVGRIPAATELHWGDAIRERCDTGATGPNDKLGWTGYKKGADGLIVYHPDPQSQADIRVVGVVEVKSMPISLQRVASQIDHHLTRLEGGLKLGDKEWTAGHVCSELPVRISVMPSAWKLIEKRREEGAPRGRVDVALDPYAPPVNTRIKQLDENNWKITLAWSKDVLAQAAYEMTYNYMAQVGECVFEEQPLPKTWQNLSPSEAGYNAIKETLYYMLLMSLPKRQDRLAAKLYNIYTHGYAVGAYCHEVLLP